jgi:hypothetical protein
MLDKIAEYRKAIAAILAPALVALAAALSDGVVTAEESVWIAIAALGTGAAVGLTPNRTPVQYVPVDDVYNEGAGTLPKVDGV